MEDLAEPVLVEQSGWSQHAIPVDARPVTFDVLCTGEDWNAVADVGGVTIRLRARGVAVADVRLVTVHELEPFDRI